MTPVAAPPLLPPLDARYRADATTAGRLTRAVDAVSGRPVALKRFPGGGSPLRWRQRFWRWARLDHPRLVRALDFGADADGAPVLVMAWIEGLDLAAVMAARRLEPDEVRAILLALAEGLSALHAAGFAHGDVKPANCVLGPDGPVLLDWCDDVAGTLAYMRPARLHGAAAEPADDWHALGVLGAELLLGVPVASLTGLPALVERLVRQAVVSPSPVAEALLGLLAEGQADGAAALARLRGEAPEGPAAQPGFRAEVPLVGRGGALALVEQALVARPGGPGAVLAWGEGGTGKSRLVREALAGRLPAAIGRGLGRPDLLVPMRPWREALAPLVGAAEAPEALAGWLATGEVGGRGSLFEAIAAWLLAHPEATLVLEDLQWVDQVSLDCLVHVAVRLSDAGRPGQVWATSRPAPGVEGLTETPRVALVPVGALDRGASAALLAAHLGQAPDDETLAWAHDLTGGNPLHLGEIAAELGRRAAGTADTSGLTALIQRVAERLPADARTLLLWGTLLGQRFTLEALQALTGWAPERLFAGVQALLEGRLWQEQDSWLDFRHDLLREGLQDAWEPEARREAHARLADWLAAEGAPLAAQGPHLAGAGRHDEAVVAFTGAGDALMAGGAPGDAVNAWRRALALIDADAAGVTPALYALWERIAGVVVAVDVVLGREVLGHMRALLHAQAPAGVDWSAAAAGLERLTLADLAPGAAPLATGSAPPEHWPVLLMRLCQVTMDEAICHILLGDLPAAEACLAEALALLPGPDHWLAGLLAIPRCTLHGWFEETAAMAALGRRAADLLGAAPEALRPALGRAHAHAHVYQLYAAVVRTGHCPEDLAAEAERLGGHEPYMAALIDSVRLAGAAYGGGWEAFQRAQQAFTASLERCGLIRTIHIEGAGRVVEGSLHHAQWAEAEARFAIFPAYLRGTFYYTWFGASAAMSACAAGRVPEAEALLRRAETESPNRGFGLSLGWAWVAAARGDADAEARLEAALARDEAEPTYHALRVLWGLRLRAWLASRRGDAAGARAALGEADVLAGRLALPVQAAINRYWEGRIAQDADARARALDAAAEAFAALGHPVWPQRVAEARVERWWLLAGASPPAPPARLGLDATLRTVVERAMATAHADRGKLLLMMPGGRLATRVSLAREGLPEVEAYSRSVAEHVLETGQAVWLADVRDDARFAAGLSLVALDLRTVICVPVRWGQALRGLLYLDRQQAREPFTADELALVVALSDFAGIALAHVETTEREIAAQAEARAAAQAARAREALVRQIVHDLRNAVQAVTLTNAELAHLTRDLPDAAAAAAGIDRQVQFMGDFLRHKLGRMMDPDGGQPAAELRPVVADVVARLGPVAAQRGVALAVAEVPAASLAIDAVELAQVLGNLAENACKFAPAGTEVALEASVASGWCVLAVADAGPGFGATGDHPAKGAGLGLRHARELVQGVGGWLRVADRAPGARVEVGLPTTAWGRADGEG
ncbi:MAG: GAF domain-containing protein [Candidatus Sericytochromatia bacterium]|nr:GAF domain-containing protein [Candidatus Sericytochromatia bacterium]